jgi:hypothetical protein
VPKIALTVSAVALATLTYTASASAQQATAPQPQQQAAPACVKRTELLSHLSNKFREAPVAMGVADNGSLLEVFSTTDGATWTVALTMPNGVTCLVATGQSWESVPRVAQFGPPV